MKKLQPPEKRHPLFPSNPPLKFIASVGNPLQYFFRKACKINYLELDDPNNHIECVRIILHDIEFEIFEEDYETLCSVFY